MLLKLQAKLGFKISHDSEVTIRPVYWIKEITNNMWAIASL